MAEYYLEIKLEDSTVYMTVNAEDELQAMDKVYEHYKNKNIEVYDIKILCINKNNMGSNENE